MKINIPAEALAKVAETHARKTEEAQKMIADSLAKEVERRRVVGFFITVEHYDDLNEDHLVAACALADDYFDDDDQIDWSAFFDRLDEIYRLCVRHDHCGAARRIQRAVRDHRRA